MTPTAIAGTVTNSTDAGSTADGEITAHELACPPAPTVTGTAGTSQASLVITPAANPQTAVTGWQYRLDAGSWQTLTTTPGAGSTRNATIGSLTSGTTYSITVRATTAGGESGDVSTPVSIVPLPPIPNAPTVSGVAGNGFALLTITPGATNAAPVTGGNTAPTPAPPGLA